MRLWNDSDHLRLGLHGLGGIYNRVLELLVQRVAGLTAVVHHNRVHGLRPVLSRAWLCGSSRSAIVLLNIRDVFLV